jgi:hypothetical protein
MGQVGYSNMEKLGDLSGDVVIRVKYFATGNVMAGEVVTLVFNSIK